MAEGTPIDCGQLVAQVRDWNVEFRLREKYHTWRLKYPLPNVPQPFYRLAEHSLTSYILCNLRWLVRASPEQVQGELGALKAAYAEMNLGSSISSEIFNFWMVLLVKLAAYFLSNHVAAVLVDAALECDIYRHTMLHLLGIHIEKNTYRILLRMFASRRPASRDRQSIKLEREDEKENDSKVKTIQSIGRRNGKHETTFFTNLTSLNDERNRLDEIKHLLKSHLYVKPIPRKPDPKYSITQLKQQHTPLRQLSGEGKQTLLEAEARATPTGKFTIQANQLSHAFSCNYALRLNDIKNHSIHCSHTKNVARPQLPQPHKRLEIKREEERPEEKRVIKPPKNWEKIVTEMKEELYQGKGHRMSEEVGPEARREQREYLVEEQAAKLVGAAQERKEQGQESEEVFRFRRLNLMNSPNIVVYEDCPIDLNDDEPPNALKSLKMNRSRLEKAERRRNIHHD